MHNLEKSAKYEIHDTFVITGRGIVFAGQILEGVISIGDSIKFKVNDEYMIRKIRGIEGVNRVSQRKTNTGLLIETISEVEIDKLRVWEPNNIVGEILKLNKNK